MLTMSTGVDNSDARNARIDKNPNFGCSIGELVDTLHGGEGGNLDFYSN